MSRSRLCRFPLGVVAMGGLIGPAVSALSAGEAVALLPEAVQSAAGPAATTPAAGARTTRPAPARKGTNPLFLVGGALVAYYVLTQPTAAPAPTGAAAVPVQVPTAPPIARPGTPVSITQVAADAHSVTMTWAPVQGAVAYQVWQYAPMVQLAQTSTNTAVIGSLQANTHYEVFVVAIGATGLQGPPSAPLLITTQTTTPPATVPSIPTALTVTDSTPTSITFSWAETAGATYYQIINDTTGQVSAPIQGTSATISGLSPGQTYTFALQACNNVGCSNPSSLTVATTTVGVAAPPPSVPTTAAAPPSAVTPTPAVPLPPVAPPVLIPMPPQAPQFIGSTATGATSANLTIGWAPVAGATYYQVVHSTGQLLAQTSQTIAVLQGLAPGATISLYVRACNSSGCSNPSAVGTFSTASLAAPTHVVSAQTGLPAVVPVGVTNPAEIAATSVQQQQPVPAGYPFASFAQAQEAVNWWSTTHPGQAVPNLTTLAPLWQAAGSPPS